MACRLISAGRGGSHRGEIYYYTTRRTFCQEKNRTKIRYIFPIILVIIPYCKIKKNFI